MFKISCEKGCQTPGLQYSYLKDVDHMMEYFNPALENLAGTPYEEDIRRIMTNLHVG